MRHFLTAGGFAATFFVMLFATATWAQVGPRSKAHPVAQRRRLAAPLPSPSPSPDPSPSPAPSPAAPPAPPAPAPVAAAAAPRTVLVESYQQALINGDRAGAGLNALSWSPCLAGVAAQNARRMETQGYISHAGGIYADIGCGLGSYAGENVGYWTGGINDVQLNQMFMGSTEHRDNIMGPYHWVGTAWVVAPNGTAFLAVEFG